MRELGNQASPWSDAVNVWSAKTSTLRIPEVQRCCINAPEKSRHALCGFNFCVFSIYDFKIKKKKLKIYEKLYMTHSQYFGDNFAGSHYAGVRVTSGG